MVVTGHGGPQGITTTSKKGTQCRYCRPNFQGLILLFAVDMDIFNFNVPELYEQN
jgi:hypothetical protein